MVELISDEIFEFESPSLNHFRTDGAIYSTPPSQISRIKVSDMATTLDNQMSQPHDLSHDTLMGLEELDSHLGIFEPSPNPAREASTPIEISNSPLDGPVNKFEQLPQIITVDSSEASYSRTYHSTGSSAGSRARPTDIKTTSINVSKYVLFPFAF